MPIPKPRSGEPKKDYISRCISFLVNEGRDSKQAAAICYDSWKNKDEQQPEEADAFDGNKNYVDLEKDKLTFLSGSFMTEESDVPFGVEEPVK